MIPTRILDEAETYLINAGHDLLTADGRRMANTLEGIRPEPNHSDADRYEIIIALVQRAAASAASGGPRIVNHGAVGEVRHYGDVHGTIRMD
jgi:hypothetical protein